MEWNLVAGWRDLFLDVYGIRDRRGASERPRFYRILCEMRRRCQYVAIGWSETRKVVSVRRSREGRQAFRRR